VEVIEFFYYGCPICYEAEPKIATWQSRAGDSIVLRRIPALAREGWEAFGRSFYALEAMGEIERLHWAVYDNFHFDGQDLKDEATMLAWVGRNGVDQTRFKEIWGSAAVTEKLHEVRRMQDEYRIRGVPSMVIDGRYVTSAGMAGDTSKMMAVVEALVARVRQERR
jgi:thiol:disulfide interchange protein DsbA